MKYYKLLKDTLTVKAGSTFEEEGTLDDEKRLVQVTKDGCQFSPWVVVRDIINFNDWFEEIPEKHERWRGKLGETYWFLSDNGSLYFKTEDGSKIDNYRYRVGNYFKTIEEARTYKKYLLARQVLLGDAEGGKWGEKAIPGLIMIIGALIIMTLYKSGSSKKICYIVQESFISKSEKHFRNPSKNTKNSGTSSVNMRWGRCNGRI